MKQISAIILGLATILVWGCSQSDSANQESAGTSAQNETQGLPKNHALGTASEAEHFTITLKAEPADLKPGRAKFIAVVLHHGKPTPTADVKLSLSMPSMNMDGPDVRLTHTADGVYEGDVELPMGGEWLAKVMVDEEGHTGTASYDFVVMK